MPCLRVVSRRGPVVESVHRVSAAAVTPDGTLLASTGDPNLVTYWRSAAKPFQALPLVEDGVLEAFGLGAEELALACASHSSEAVHLALTDRFLARIGCVESDLACGPHTPLGSVVAEEVRAAGTTLTPRWSNCSGKHAGMLALAKFHGWPLTGYEQPDHPVQRRILDVVSAWTGIHASRILLGTDGCATVCFGLPLRAMARAYANLATATQPAPTAVREAMMAHPHLVAGRGRFCTELMLAIAGQLIVKVGAEGVYCAGLPGAGIGLALKIEDGHALAAPLALLAALRQLSHRLGAMGVPEIPQQGLEHWEAITLRNTRRQPVGELRAEGTLEILEP